MVLIIKKHVFKRKYYRWMRKDSSYPNDNLLFDKGDVAVNFAFKGSSGLSNNFVSIDDSSQKMREEFAYYKISVDPDETLKKLLSGEITEVRIYENGIIYRFPIMQNRYHLIF